MALTPTKEQATEKSTGSYFMSFLSDIIPYFKSSGENDVQENSNRIDIGDQNPMKDLSDSVLSEHYISSDDKGTELSSHLGSGSDEKKIHHEIPFYDNPFEFIDVDEMNGLRETSRIKRLGMLADNGQNLVSR